MLIGDPTEAVNVGRRCGSVFEYAYSAGKWREVQQIISPHQPHHRCPEFDSFGYSVALAGRTAVISTDGKTYIMKIR